jgi:hypothetical protein
MGKMGKNGQNLFLKMFCSTERGKQAISFPAQGHSFFVKKLKMGKMGLKAARKKKLQEEELAPDVKDIFRGVLFIEMKVMKWKRNQRSVQKEFVFFHTR